VQNSSSEFRIQRLNSEFKIPEIQNSEIPEFRVQNSRVRVGTQELGVKVKG
jgi:hypothetical protein